MDYSRLISEYIEAEVSVLRKLDIESIVAAVNILADALEKEKNVFIFGNGGSSSTASHFQNDFNRGLSACLDKKFRFTCLNDNVPTILAIANDHGYDQIFRMQLEGKIKQGDVVIAISGSGNSANILQAVEYAKEGGTIIIGLTGYDGGELKHLSDVSLHAPVNSMQITEDIHMMFDHLMMSVLYKTLCGKDHMKNE